MTTEEAIKLTKELTNAAIAHYAAVNFLTHKNPQKACEKESKAVRKVLAALTDSPITQADIDRVME